MAIIRVESPTSEYDIVIESGLFRGQVVDRFSLNHAIVVTNETVGPLHGERFAALIGAPLLSIPDGERFKNLETVAALYGDFVRAGIDRSSTVIALGGGVVGDLVGFVAATYMRGVRLVQVPTTLLSMVDSSVGGKVGVDLPQGKNLVGAFKQPDVVLIDPEVLGTLPDVEWCNGMAEVLKHSLIDDAELLNPDLHSLKKAEALVTRAVQVKVNVVQRDPYEKGERAHLNLGHTFGHAIEHVTGYEVPHGQAVAMGLVAAAKLSVRLNLCAENIIDQVESALESTGLPTKFPAVNASDLWATMKTDKKWRGGRSRFVLLRAIGEPCIIENIVAEDAVAIMRELGAK